MLKVIEVLGFSEKSWEDAAQSMVKEASKSIHNIKSIYVQDMSAKVKKDKIVQYRIDGRITFQIMH